MIDNFAVGSPIQLVHLPQDGYADHGCVRFKVPGGETFPCPIVAWAVVVYDISANDEDEPCTVNTTLEPVVQTNAGWMIARDAAYHLWDEGNGRVWHTEGGHGAAWAVYPPRIPR